MADELSIILKSKIGDTQKDISDLNRQIATIQEKLNKVDLSIGLDSNVMASLDKFVKSIEQARDLSKEMTQAIKEEITETRNLDGSIQRVTTQWLKNGEVIQKTKNIIKQQTQETQNATQEARKLASEWDTVGQKIRQATKENGSGQQIGGTDTYKNGNTTQTVNYDANGQVTSARTVENLQAEIQATQTYGIALNNLKDNIAQLQEKMVSLGDAGQHTTSEFNALTQALHNEEASSNTNISSVQRLTNQYAQLEQEISRVETLGSRRMSVDSSVFSASGQSQTQQLRDYITQAYASEGATHNLEQTQISLSSAFDRAGNQIHSYTVAINDGDGTVRRYSGDIDRLSSAIYQNSQRTTQATHSQQGFMEQFGIALARVPIWLGATTAIFGTLHTLQNIVSTIVEVDTQMTQLKRVMNTGTDFNDMLQKSIDMSNELGQKLTDVLAVESQFGSAGFSSTDTLALTKVTALLQNISDLQPQEAMTAITAAMKSFNISAQDSITIANKLNNVDNNYTITTKDLADGLTKSAAAARAYGVSLDDLLGMEAAVNGVTKESGNIIGNSLKTIFSRLETSSGSIKALQSVGIEVKDAAGNMKSATVVLGDLASKWNTLTSAQQQSIAVTVAGRYQLTRFLALMQNWGTVINASNTALNSQNSAINENAKYQESLQAKINRLNTAWKELSLAMGNAVVTNGFIDLVNGLKDLATVATPVVKTVGVLPIVLGSAGFAAITFSSKIREMVLGLTITKTAMQALSVESVALKGAIASTGIGLAFIGIGFALEKIIGYYGQVNAEHEKEQQQLDQSLRGYQENTKQVSAWVEEYSKLDKLKNNGGLDNTQQQQYLDIQQKIANVLPTVVAGTDAQGRSVLVSSDALKANIALLKQKIQLEHESTVISAPQDIQNSNNNINSFRDQIKQKEDDVKQLNDAIKQSNELINNPKSSSFTKNSNLALVSQWTKDLNNDQKDILGLQIKINDEYSKQEAKVKSILSVYKGLSSGDVNWLAKLVTDGKVSVDQIDNLGKTIQSVRKDIGKPLPNDFFSNMTVDQIKNIANLSDEYKHGQISLIDYEKALDHSGLSISKVSTLIDGVTTSQDKNTKSTLSNVQAQLTLQDILDGKLKTEDALMQGILGYTQADIDQKQKLINIYNTLSQVQDKDDAQKQLLKATVQQLIEQFPGLVNGHNVNIKAMMNEVNAQSILVQAVTKAANGQLSAEQITTLGKVQATNKRIEAMKNEIRGLETLQTAYDHAAQMVERTLTNIDKGMAVNSGDVAKWTTIAMQTRNLLGSVGGDNLGGLVSQMNGLESSNNSNLNKLGKSIGYTPPYSTSTYPSSSGSSKSKKGKSSGSGSSSTPVAEYQTDKYQQSLDALDEKIKEVDASTQKLDHTSKGYIDGLKEEISLTKQKEKVVNSEISALEKRDKAIQKQLKSMGSFNHLSNAQKQTYNQLAQELDQNTQKINQLKDANIGFANDMANIQGQITQVYSDLADQVVQIEKDAYEKERQIALDANKKKMDDLDAEHNKIMQNYDDEMSKYQDVTDQKTKALDKASSDRSYNESLSAKQKAAQDTLNQINVMKLDTSAEGQAKLADLQKQYAQEQQDIQDTQYQHGVDLQKQNLQDQATSYQKDIDAKKKAEDDKYNATKAELQKEQDAINKYYDNIANDDRKWAKLHQDIMNGHFDQVKKDFKKFTDILKGHMDELGQSITQNLLDTLDQASKEMAALTGASTPSSSGSKSSGSSKSTSSGSSHKSSSGSSHHDSSSSSHKSNRYYTVRKGDTLSDIAEKYYGHGTPYYYDKIANANHISNPDKIYPGERLLIPYDTGGYTGSWGSDGRLALLHQKELVLNKDDTTNMLKMVNIVRDLIPKINFPDLSNLAGKLGNTIHMPITIQNLNGGKEGATEFFNIIGNHMKIMGVNN